MCDIVIEEIERFVFSLDGAFVIAVGEDCICSLASFVYWEGIGAEARALYEQGLDSWP